MPTANSAKTEVRAAGESRQVASVARALRILELLIAHPDHEQGVSQIARDLGVGKSTAHQLLATLAAHGFVDQSEDSPRYRLGTRLMEAGAVASTHVGLGPALTPILEEMVRTVGETSSVGIMASKEIVLIHRVEAKSVLRVDLKVGTRFPLHNSAIGRVIVSAMPEPARTHLIGELSLTADERRELSAALDFVQEHGYSVVRDIPVQGINAIAVAIRNKSGRPIAGLVIAGPSFRFEPDHYRDIAMRTAGLISERIGSSSIG